MTSKPMKAILYARVSRDDGVQNPAVQLHALRDWAGVRGWTIVGEEFDRITGDPSRRSGDPPGLRRALQSVQDKKANLLVVFAADRLVRSPVGLIQLISRVQTLGGHVVSLQDGADLDTSTDAGELFVFLRGWWARMELRLLRARTLAGLARAKAAGKTLGRPAKADPTTVFHLRTVGCSWTQIASQLGCSVAAARGAAERFARSASNGGSEPAISPVEKAPSKAPPKTGAATGRFPQGAR